MSDDPPFTASLLALRIVVQVGYSFAELVGHVAVDVLVPVVVRHTSSGIHGVVIELRRSLDRQRPVVVGKTTRLEQLVAPVLERLVEALDAAVHLVDVCDREVVLDSGGLDQVLE